MKLIMNADDFGLSESVNNGIAECFKAGIVKSTTIMMNQPGVEHAIQLYQQGLISEVGLHFTVTSGKPLSDPKTIPSLVDHNGHFYGRTTLMNKQDVRDDDVYCELNAQYTAALNAGFKINHIDSHHFAGVYEPLKNAFIEFANEVGLPVRRVDNIVQGQQSLRVKTPDVFDLSFYDDGVSLNRLQQVLLAHKVQHPDGLIELMCHPSSDSYDDLYPLSNYVEKRAEEMALLTSLELKQWLDSEEIECVGFDALHP